MLTCVSPVSSSFTLTINFHSFLSHNESSLFLNPSFLLFFSPQTCFSHSSTISQSLATVVMELQPGSEVVNLSLRLR